MGLPETIMGEKFTTTPAMATSYAELTSDRNPIHLDPVFAATTPFGAPIIHGTMGLNLLVEVLERALGPAFATAETDIRFVRPVLVGQTIQAGARLKDAASGAYEVYVESEDGARAVEGTLVLKPDAGRPAR